jgi:hypothetical protein
VDRYDPDLWTDEVAFLNQPGQAEIQSDLFYDYRTIPSSACASLQTRSVTAEPDSARASAAD